MLPIVRGERSGGYRTVNQKLSQVERLLAVWNDETVPAARRANIAVLALLVVGGILLGRSGLEWSRPGAACVVLIGVIPLVLTARLRRARARDPRAAITATLVRTEPALGHTALRALALADRITLREDVGSSELAALHLSRVLGRASPARVSELAGRVAWRWTAVGALASLGGFVLVLVEPFRLVEGLDVLAAKGGVAPLGLAWVKEPVVWAEPPSYLDLERESLRPFEGATVPVGTRITVRAEPRHRGRALVLTDGRTETPFVDDGNGGLLAHFTAMADLELTVAARFGAVLVPEPRSLAVDALVDPAPVVRLEGAPSVKRLVDEPRISVRWKAHDDHALAEVLLVLRAGEREERRRLSKPQGGTRTEQGGLELFGHDRFIVKSHVPIEVTVEALDDDAVSGPKWGRSAAFVLVPPAIGEREVLRYRALVRARDALTDLLGRRLEGDLTGTATAAAQKKAQAEALGVLAEVLAGSYGGLRVPGKIVAMARGQMERLEKALGTKKAGKLGIGVNELALRSEDATLALDAVIAALGARDTRSSALSLSDVATDVALAIKLGSDADERARADRRLGAALTVLELGGANLLELGSLGLDLGEIVDNGLRRIRRALDAGDRHHARLAAEDLAARLRQPDPSFGSSGGGDGHSGEGQAGVEAGGGGEGEAEKASDAAEQADGLDAALEELRREHAAERAGVSRSLEEAVTDEERAKLKQELRALAEEVRKTVEDLPQESVDADSAEAKAARGRAAGEAMAGELEKGELGEATEHGKKALKELAGAERAGRDHESGDGDHEIGAAAGRARDKLAERVAQAERRLAELRKKSSDAARTALEQAGRRERGLGERARKLRDESEASEAPLPDEMMQRLAEAERAMQDAAEHLGEGRGQAGLDGQDAAQRLLELAQPEQDASERGAGEGEQGQLARDAEVPPERRDVAADRFRRRVTEGLGRGAPPHLRDAVRRYTEGLLK